MGDYDDDCLATDVLLLTDVFETFLITCLNHYKLDPAQIFRIPRSAWQALSKIESEYCEHEASCRNFPLCPGWFRLELLRDMLLIFEKPIQG